jgi:beta-glucosidase
MYSASMKRLTFPEGFIWGAASAAYQIEGSPLADGAGATSWHEFSHRRGTIIDGTNGDVACDHYHRYPEDIQILRDLGLKAYRFSVGWGRVFPEPGKLNPEGLNFYDRVVDGLLAAGIDPWVTLFHLEEPAWLLRKGGIASRESVDHLVQFGEAVLDRLGDRVHNWITINEPTIYAYSGYLVGEFPPGKKLAIKGMLHSVHHLLLAHARLCEAWRARGTRGLIGLAHHSVWVAPADPTRARDVQAAAFMDDLANGAVLSTIVRGVYPERVVQGMGRFLPRGFEKDLSEMGKPVSYIGINYYTRNLYKWSRFMPFMHASEYAAPGSKRSAMWEIYPRGIRESLLRLKNEYGNPLCYITENGFPLKEDASRDPLDDQERIDYLSDHIANVAQAISEGANCRGYFHWSLMDNFEWNKGLSMRFGLIRTDFATQVRTWKKSAFWYRDLAKRNALDVPD